MLAQFKHPALVEVFRFWEENGTAYMAMPLYEGPTLKHFLSSHPEMSNERWLRGFLAPVLDALEHMHGMQVYHRDIAPDNLLILKNGAPLLLDLGAARRDRRHDPCANGHPEARLRYDRAIRRRSGGQAGALDGHLRAGCRRLLRDHPQSTATSGFANDQRPLQTAVGTRAGGLQRGLPGRGGPGSAGAPGIASPDDRGVPIAIGRSVVHDEHGAHLAHVGGPGRRCRACFEHGGEGRSGSDGLAQFGRHRHADPPERAAAGSRRSRKTLPPQMSFPPAAAFGPPRPTLRPSLPHQRLARRGGAHRGGSPRRLALRRLSLRRLSPRRPRRPHRPQPPQPR
jgi:hypothetical protein